MRTGPRVALCCVVLFAAVCSRAFAADSLSVFADNSQAALGASTLLAAEARTDAGYGGGHVVWKYARGDARCAATPAADTGTDANGPIPAAVPPGAGTTDVGGQMVSLGLGGWQICGWLVDDSNGATVAAGSTTVRIVPYIGSVSLSVRPVGKAFQVVISYTTSAPARLYAWVQKARRSCSRGAPHHVLALVPRSGWLVGSDGGLGRSIPAGTLGSGHWRVCGSLRAGVGHAGPATKAFVVPRSRLKHGGRAAG